ncbi:MAG: hypothetical protein ACE5HU_00875 [Acidobacteriota bacterium]
MRVHLLAALCVLIAGGVFGTAPRAQIAQFGHFGKNKVIYKNFDWKIYRAPHFDVYYYSEEEPFLEQVVSYAESAFLQLSDALDHTPQFRTPLIFYKTHGDFEQTNITLGFIPQSVGAFAEPLQKRMVLPIDQPPDKLYALITHELTHIFEYSMLFNDSGSRALFASPPLWLMEGLASHMAHDEDSVDRMIIRDAVVNGLIPPITRVRGLSFLTYRFGQAAFDFIEQEFGPEGIRSFLSEYRKVLLTSNIEKAIKESFGTDAEEFDRRFRRFLMKKYIPILLKNNEPEDYGKEIGIKAPGVFTFSPALSPSGDLIAVMTNKKEDLDVVIINATSGKMVRNLTKGLTTDYDSLVAAIFQGKNDLSWSPTGDQVAVFARKENRRVLLVYNAVTGKRVVEKVLDVDVAESPAFSPDGRRIAFSGNRNGQVDIFEYNLGSKILTNITNDPFYDSNPSWSTDGETILYNRRINSFEKIFLLDYNDPEQKTQVTFGETSDIQPSFSRDGMRIYYASDAGPHNIFNIYSLDLESGEIDKYSDVISGHFSPREMVDEDGNPQLVTTAYWRGRFRLFTVNLDKPVAVIRPEERVQEPKEIVPFKSALQLTVDEAEKRPYDKLKYHLETTPDVLVGVASDGTFVGNAFLVFSDLLGDHRFWINTQAVSSFTNLDVGFINMKHRLQWFASASDFRDFVVLRTGSGRFTREQSNRISAAQGGFVFPFNTFTKLRVSGGVQNRDVIGTDIDSADDPATGKTFAELSLSSESGTSPFVSTSIINDTARYKSFGPWQGKRINFGVSTFPASTGSLGNYTAYSLDFRTYQRITRRSLLAWRLASNIGIGDGAPLYGIGGINQIRGYRFREFLGDQSAFMNLELRFPLLDELRFPFGSIRQLRGVLFFDLGTAWTQDGLFWDNRLFAFRDFKFWDSDNNRLQDGRASYGLGFSFRLGFLNLNWNFAHTLPHSETINSAACNAAIVSSFASIAQDCQLVRVEDPGFRSDFWVGFPF